MTLQEMDDAALLSEYENSVKWWHYCPCSEKEWPQPKFTPDEIRAELTRRLGDENG